MSLIRHGAFTAGLLASALACSGEREAAAREGEGPPVVPAAAPAVAPGLAFVRFVNALPAPGVAVLRIGEELPFKPVSYKSVTPYVGVRTTVLPFALLDSAGLVLARHDAAVLAGERYTVIAMPEDAVAHRPTLRVLRDVPGTADSTARVRVVNALADGRGIDVRLEPSRAALFEDLMPGMEVAFKPVAPIGARLAITGEDGAWPILTLARKQFQAGRAYTVVVTGAAGAAEAITFDDLLADDAAMAAGAGAPADST